MLSSAYMRVKHPIRVGIMLFAVALSVSAQQSHRGSVDWILVLDTSASMHGAGGSANIFDRVKTTISDFIRNTRQGDSVALYTFDRDTSLRSHVRINGELDKSELIRTVDGLTSNGDRTHTGKAIHDALERAAELRNRSDAAQRTVSIVLFTDGLEDVRGLVNPISIPSNISLIPQNPPYLFFVSLGAVEHERQLEDFVQNPALQNRGEVVRDPAASSIAEVADRIRQKIEAPPEPRELNLRCEPASLNFGKIEPGETTSDLELRCQAEAKASVTLALGGTDNSVRLKEPQAAVQLEAGQPTAVEVRLEAREEAGDGNRVMQLAVTPASNESNVITHPALVNVGVEVARVPLWKKLIKYGLAVLILVLLALAALSVIKGEPPWIWIPTIFEGDKLEGELQIIQPRPERSQDEFISLRQLATKTILLSSLIPNGATADSDAEISVAKKKGEIFTQLVSKKGTVKVNKVEIATTEIYNDDLIEIGNLKFRFNWLNHERPTEPHPDEWA